MADEVVNKQGNALRSRGFACIGHALALIDAATTILDSHKPDIAYFLVVGAIEEFAKARLCISGSAIEEILERPVPFRAGLDKHKEKLFAAIWNPLSDLRDASPAGFDRAKQKAAELHRKRLACQYVNVDDLDTPYSAEVVSREEVNALIELARQICDDLLETCDAVADADAAEILEWVLDPAAQAERLDILLSAEGREKFAELNDQTAWLHWGMEKWKNVVESVAAHLERELSKPKVGLLREEGERDKWLVTVEVFTTSHRIPARVLAVWNSSNFSRDVRLEHSHKEDSFLVRITLPESIHLTDVTKPAYDIARKLILAFNIVTGGYFWWCDTPHREKFYTQIRDLDINEKRSVLVLDDHAVKFGWSQDRKLSDTEIRKVALVFTFLLSIQADEEREVFDAYESAILYLAKSDVHSWHLTESFSAFRRCVMATKCYGCPVDEPTQMAAKLLSLNVDRVVGDDLLQIALPILAGQTDLSAGEDVRGATTMAAKLVCDSLLLSILGRVIPARFAEIADSEKQ